VLPITEMTACRVPVRISVFDIARRRTEVLHDRDLAARSASCAVPGLFHPVWIDRRAYWDGGILTGPGLDGVPVGERVLLHHISSRSPWRGRLDVPRARGRVALVLDGLPRAGPFRLDAGRRALNARSATRPRGRSIGRSPMASYASRCESPPLHRPDVDRVPFWRSKDLASEPWQGSLFPSLSSRTWHASRAMTRRQPTRSRTSMHPTPTRATTARCNPVTSSRRAVARRARRAISMSPI
jgi:hypothetical protein